MFCHIIETFTLPLLFSILMMLRCHFSNSKCLFVDSKFSCNPSESLSTLPLGPERIILPSVKCHIDIDRSWFQIFTGRDRNVYWESTCAAILGLSGTVVAGVLLQLSCLCTYLPVDSIGLMLPLS